MWIHARWAAVTAVLVSLYGCGGSGGGGSGNEPPPTYGVGGTVTGLNGSGLVLTLNGSTDLAVGSSGSFAFTGALASGSSYAVTVKSQPANQTCVVSNASGTVGSAAVANVSVSCSTNTYSIGGAVSGLTGSGLVLSLNDDIDLAVPGSGNFTFATPLPTGANYSVTVKAQPTAPSQTCAVTNASGTVGSAAVANVSVSCSTNTYSIGGAASGLTGSGLVVSLNGDVDLAVAGSGNFTFATPLPSGTNYSVTVETQPSTPSQTCAITNASGTVGSASVANVSLSCTTNTYVVNASVTGLTGSGLVLRLNSIDQPVGADGTISFALDSGANYSLTIATQPSSPQQTCVATNSSGVIGNGDATVSVTCTTDTYAVGGTVSGLTGAGLELQLNGGDQELAVASDGSFLFPAPLLSGAQYTVSVKTQTSTHREVCAVTRATGVVTTQNITNVKVDCAVVLGFIYVVAADGQITEYGILPSTGALLPLGPVAAVGGTQLMAATPNGSTLYAAGTQLNSIYSFSVDSSKGTLTALGSPIPVGPSDAFARELVVAPSGKFLYVANFSAGTIQLYSIDVATGELTSQGTAATTPTVNTRVIDLEMTPDGAFLYSLNNDSTTSTRTLTVYSIDAISGALTPGATVSATSIDGVTVDALSRFAYLRDSFPAPPDLFNANTTIYPHTIDPVTGALTAVNVNVTVLNNGHQLAIAPSGQYAYLMGSVFIPESNYIDMFSIDQTTGALTTIGARVPVDGRPLGGLMFDATGQFLFAGNNQQNGTFDPNVVPYDSSSYVIQTSGPMAGQLSAVGTGAGLQPINTAMVVIQ